VEDFENVRKVLGGPDTNAIVWLDYTSPKDRHDQLQELETLMPKLIAGDVARITMNAHRTTLGENDVYLQVASDRRPHTLAQWRHAKLKVQLGMYLPPERDDPEYLATKDEFYRTMIRAIKRAVVRGLNSRPELLGFPLLSTAYDDQHGMVTATCLILQTEREDQFMCVTRWEEWDHKPGPEWDQLTEIQVPHLSLRERHILHRLIEIDGTFGGDKPGFIEDSAFEQYKTHYLRYPTFAPLESL